MTQILNVPMPADEAMKIIRGIKESNSMTEVRASFYYDFVDFCGKAHRVKQDWIVKDINDYAIISDVTIKSITPIIPTYSVWQVAMVLKTMQTGIVKHIDDTIGLYDDEEKIIGIYHRSEICKVW